MYTYSYGDTITEERPFLNLKSDHVRDRGILAFNEYDVNTLHVCLNELKDHRKPCFVASYITELERLVRVLNTYNYLDGDKHLPNAEWLLGVANVVDDFTTETKGITHVYLVCLWDCDRNKQYGIYVGQTSLPIYERYSQHKEGFRAGRKWVMKYGIGLMEPLFQHLMNMNQNEALELEHDIAKALTDAGFIVKGGH